MGNCQCQTAAAATATTGEGGGSATPPTTGGGGEGELLLLGPDLISLTRQMVARCETEGTVETLTLFLDQMIELHEQGILQGKVHENFLRQLLTKDRSFMSALREWSPTEAQRFVVAPNIDDDSNRTERDSARKEAAALLKSPQAQKLEMAQVFRHQRKGDPDILEGTGKPVPYVENAEFRNWGRTVTNTPWRTFLPTTKQGVCNIVKWSRRNNLRVRVAGYRHSWSSVFSDDHQVLISLMPLAQAEELPWREPPLDPSNELQGIQMVGQMTERNGVVKGLCQVGVGTSNEMFREWVIDNARVVPNKRKKKKQQSFSWKQWWTLPFNVIMVEITMGGSNAGICHGAGIRHKTLSDLVYSMEFVNAQGNLQTVSDPALLQAAAGCFGLCGVVTAITFKLDILTFATFAPTKTRVGLTIPPPKDYKIPDGVDMSGITPAELEQARLDFIHKCETNYYAEWFWFPTSKECWVNCWNNDGKAKDAKEYPSPVQVKVQNGISYISELMNTFVFTHLPPSWQLKILTTFSMRVLPDSTTVTPLIEALHFRRGIQNMRVRDMEWEIPIPGMPGNPDKPDWSICQRAWWDAISLFYRRYNANRNDCPMRLTLEMRVYGNSDIYMAPVHGNRHGTCSIEVLTPENVDHESWMNFLQELVDLWLSYTDENGILLNSRPHWVKEWQGLQVRGQDIRQYLKQHAYPTQIAKFQTGVAAIASAGGTTLSAMRDLFVNDLWDDLLGPQFYQSGF
ncbi:hypothetical protein ACA910_007148 [Epithemia clementina (nom. ined.)]